MSEPFIAELEARLRSHVAEGTEVLTIGDHRRNEICAVSSLGIDVMTDSSDDGPALVPAWMFNRAWDLLHEGGIVERREIAYEIKRASAVMAVLAELPEVTIKSRFPAAIALVQQQVAPAAWRLRAWDDPALEATWRELGIVAMSEDEIGDLTA